MKTILPIPIHKVVGSMGFHGCIYLYTSNKQ